MADDDWARTHVAGDILDLLHVLLVWCVVRQAISLGLVLVVLHPVQDLAGGKCQGFSETKT